MYGSKIAWTDHTFNPWMGCVKVSAGCTHCYAETLTTNRMGLDLWGKTKRRQVTSHANWKKPIAWNREAKESGTRSRVFSGSLCDVFEPRSDLAQPRRRLFDLIASTPRLTWLLLTKRPEHIASALPANWNDGWENVWLGTTIESDSVAHRADHLRRIPARVRFVSYEPAIGPLETLDLRGIHWVIYGGESGPKFRPHDVQWARSMRDRCSTSGVAFFFKQSPGYRTETGIELDGKIIRQFPSD